jgi:hypothetical protein
VVGAGLGLGRGGFITMRCGRRGSQSHGEAGERREWRRALCLRVLCCCKFFFCPSENLLVFGVGGLCTVWLELGGREARTFTKK